MVLIFFEAYHPFFLLDQNILAPCTILFVKLLRHQNRTKGLNQTIAVSLGCLLMYLLGNFVKYCVSTSNSGPHVTGKSPPLFLYLHRYPQDFQNRRSILHQYILYNTLKRLINKRNINPKKSCSQQKGLSVYSRLIQQCSDFKTKKKKGIADQTPKRFHFFQN